MMRSIANLEMHELIGLQSEVVDSTNPLQKGISGLVVDETKNTLLIRTNRGDKRIQKKGAKFNFIIEDKVKLVDGNEINYRPQDRTKKLVWRRKKW